MEEKVYSIIVDTLQEIISDLGDANTIAISADTRLLGKNGLLNSLLLVSFIADLEGEIEENFGKEIVLADEKAMSQSQSPFLSVDSLTKYIIKLLTEE